jgi:hypothetical protein
MRVARREGPGNPPPPREGSRASAIAGRRLDADAITRPPRAPRRSQWGESAPHWPHSDRARGLMNGAHPTSAPKRHTRPLWRARHVRPSYVEYHSRPRTTRTLTAPRPVRSLRNAQGCPRASNGPSQDPTAPPGRRPPCYTAAAAAPGPSSGRGGSQHRAARARSAGQRQPRPLGGSAWPRGQCEPSPRGQRPWSARSGQLPTRRGQRPWSASWRAPSTPPGPPSS